VGFREAFTGTGGWGEERGDENWRRNFTTEDVFERIVGAGVTSRRENKNGVSLLRGDAAEVFATENLSARVSNRAKGDTEEMDYWW
jgi:hypothetical protein